MAVAANLAASFHIAKVNLGNAFDATLGGVGLAAGLRRPMGRLTEAATSAIGLMIVLIALRQKG